MTRVASIKRREAVAALVWLVVLVVLVAVLRPFRNELETGTAALVLLLAPLVAALGSLRLSVVAAIVSALTFNYFFTEPYDTLIIASDASVAAFIVYLGIAVAFGVVTHRLRAATDTSDRRAAEATLVRDLTIDLVRQSVWLEPPIASALADLVRALDLRGAAVRVRIADGEQFLAPAGDAAEAERAIDSFDAVHDDTHVRSLRTDTGVLLVPVASADAVYGLLGVQPRDRAIDDADERVARLFANVVALACERRALSQAFVHRRALEETDRLRTTLMQSITHDLRTPLTSIRALASALLATDGLDAQQAELLGSIEEQAERLARLVDQVLDLSRIEGGVLQPKVANLAVDDLIRAAVETVGDAGVQVSIEAGLPSVPVDEPLMQQVLVNLIENARLHGQPPVEVRARRRHNRVELSVVDHGRGVAEAERRRLFDPTSAMRRSTAEDRSRGLGLAVSAGFVEAHHGHIRVDPTPGGGATFVVSLPTAETERG